MHRRTSTNINYEVFVFAVEERFHSFVKQLKRRIRISEHHSPRATPWNISNHPDIVHDKSVVEWNRTCGGKFFCGFPEDAERWTRNYKTRRSADHSSLINYLARLKYTTQLRKNRSRTPEGLHFTASETIALASSNSRRRQILIKQWMRHTSLQFI